MIPSGWQKNDLSEFIDIKHGFAFKSEYFREEGKCVLLTPGSFYEKGGFKDQGVKTKYYDGEIPDTYLLTEGDLLVAMTEQATGLLGSTLFVPESNVYLHNQRLGKIIIKNPEKLEKGFLYVIFNAPYVRKQVSSQSTGTKVKHTSPDKLKSVICLLPPVCEQRKIAKILSTWDKAISATERLIENSKQQKKSLMQQLLTGKKRLLDDLGKPYEGDWEVLTFAEIAKIKKGKALSSKHLEPGEFPVIAGGKSSPYKHSKYTHENIITISASGAYAGFVAYHKQKIWASDCSVVEVKENSITQFVFQFLLLNQTKIYSLQSGGAQPHIYPKDIEVLKVSVPSLAEQQKIVAVLTSADKEIELLEQQLTDLKQEKQALMQQLLTGKRRVKIDDKEVA